MKTGSFDLKDCEWLLIIRVPDFIKEKDLRRLSPSSARRGKAGDFENVKLESIDEGSCVQMLHVGPYNQENRTIDQMLAFAENEGLTCRGKHHEIYLSDPRRLPPERLAHDPAVTRGMTSGSTDRARDADSDSRIRSKGVGAG